MTRRLIAAVAALVILAGIVFVTSGSDESKACVSVNASVAREWNEAALAAIRRDFPAPTVHARNLFHLSEAMWNVWAIFDADARPTLVWASRNETADLDTSISWAAYTVLSSRYAIAVGSEESLTQFDELLVELCLDPGRPDPLGQRIGQAVLDNSSADGSLESERYVADYEPANGPLTIDEAGTTMFDPNRWQQLEFAIAMTQNGQLLESNLQEYVGPHWGEVTGFALPDGQTSLPYDPGPPPLHGTATQPDFELAAAEVVSASSQLDPIDGQTIDISPGERGNNDLGTNNGNGHRENPATARPYETHVVAAGDYYRAIAEFWADGPSSETPPGHWNAISNEVSDALPELRIGGAGLVVDRLEWDVTLYFALNGALHDAAIAAWGIKAEYDYARPISMIRYLSGTGTLPTDPGLIEIITDESSAPGGHHEDLAEYVGETAVLSWAPEPVFFGEDLPKVRWIRGVEWVPYQRATFVTPAFPGYISGHSTFSRAAAEVLTTATGSEFFPAGIATHTVSELEFEDGPNAPVELQWATYYDAADEAGLSRIYGGIHVRADDLEGRSIGSAIGQAAWERATEFFG